MVEVDLELMMRLFNRRDFRSVRVLLLTQLVCYNRGFHCADSRGRSTPLCSVCGQKYDENQQPVHLDESTYYLGREDGLISE